MNKRLALYVASFNPPGWHHRAVVEALHREFDSVVVVPEGPRRDDPAAEDVAPIHRAAMADIAFRDLPGVRVDLADLELDRPTRIPELVARFEPEGEAWLVVTAARVRGGGESRSVIQTGWENGPDLWRMLRFAVIARPGETPPTADMPPRSVLVAVPAEGASRVIRERIFRHEDPAGLVPPEVREYIERYALYRGRPPVRIAPIRLDPPRPEWVMDTQNPRAAAIAAKLPKSSGENPPNCIAVVGGDGTMLHAIRQHWRRRLPFLGINAGHRGFLLNGAEDFDDGWPADPLLVRQAPLLHVEVEPAGGGETRSVFAFNDAWMERRTSQAAWIEVRVGGEARIPHLIADGVLLATAAGSTAYARAMGATPVLFDTPVLVLVGSNVLEPPNWKAVMLGLDTEVEFHSLQPDKRPLGAFADGIPLGEAARMRIRVSRIATAELVFSERHDMAGKIAQLQFPPK
jgi:NAD+ kinase